MLQSSSIPSSVRIGAVLRFMDGQFIPYYVLQKGNDDSGTLLVSLIDQNNRVKLLSERRKDDGKAYFSPVHKEETLAPHEASEYIQRAKNRDPDMWVIEIEAKNHHNPFEQEIYI